MFGLVEERHIPESYTEATAASHLDSMDFIPSLCYDQARPGPEVIKMHTKSDGSYSDSTANYGRLQVLDPSSRTQGEVVRRTRTQAGPVAERSFSQILRVPHTRDPTESSIYASICTLSTSRTPPNAMAELPR